MAMEIAGLAVLRQGFVILAIAIAIGVAIGLISAGFFMPQPNEAVVRG
jgi:hypothetical protein